MIIGFIIIIVIIIIIQLIIILLLIIIIFIIIILVIVIIFIITNPLVKPLPLHAPLVRVSPPQWNQRLLLQTHVGCNLIIIIICSHHCH